MLFRVLSVCALVLLLVIWLIASDDTLGCVNATADGCVGP